MLTTLHCNKNDKIKIIYILFKYSLKVILINGKLNKCGCNARNVLLYAKIKGIVRTDTFILYIFD
jgi:hypothetical protein